MTVNSTQFSTNVRRFVLEYIVLRMVLPSALFFIVLGYLEANYSRTNTVQIEFQKLLIPVYGLMMFLFYLQFFVTIEVTSDFVSFFFPFRPFSRRKLLVFKDLEEDFIYDWGKAYYLKFTFRQSGKTTLVEYLLMRRKENDELVRLIEEGINRHSPNRSAFS